MEESARSRDDTRNELVKKISTPQFCSPEMERENHTDDIAQVVDDDAMDCEEGLVGGGTGGGLKPMKLPFGIICFFWFREFVPS